jgi:hypothetical protein
MSPRLQTVSLSRFPVLVVVRIERASRDGTSGTGTVAFPDQVELPPPMGPASRFQVPYTC